jgi:hypothetical protein
MVHEVCNIVGKSPGRAARRSVSWIRCRTRTSRSNARAWTSPNRVSKPCAGGRRRRLPTKTSLPPTRRMRTRCAGSCSAGSRRSTTRSRSCASDESTRNRASAGTSAGATSRTETAFPSSSTGGRASRRRSTGPHWPTRSVSTVAAVSCSALASSLTSSRRTSPIPTHSRARVGCPIRYSPSSGALGRGRCATSSRPSRPSRTPSSARRSRRAWWCKVVRARGRPPSACIAPRSCCTSTAPARA